jgi:hypothetical protein
MDQELSREQLLEAEVAELRYVYPIGFHNYRLLTVENTVLLSKWLRWTLLLLEVTYNNSKRSAKQTSRLWSP